jgi:hypothetical protein
MPIESVKIPQNVYIEDRIIGPLSLRQIAIILIGSGISYMFYTTIARANGGHLSIVPAVLCWIPAIIAALFAVLKVNDLSLLRICLQSHERFNKPSERVWAPRRGLSIHIRTNIRELEEKTAKEKLAEEQAATAALRTEKKIQELSSVLDHSIPLGGINKKTPPADTQESAPASSEEKQGSQLPVNPNHIRADQTKPPNDGLSAYEGVFLDIQHPRS